MDLWLILSSALPSHGRFWKFCKINHLLLIKIKKCNWFWFQSNQLENLVSSIAWQVKWLLFNLGHKFRICQQINWFGFSNFYLTVILNRSSSFNGTSYLKTPAIFRIPTLKKQSPTLSKTWRGEEVRSFKVSISVMRSMPSRRSLWKRDKK